jgi:hypothetical protein
MHARSPPFASFCPNVLCWRPSTVTSAMTLRRNAVASPSEHVTQMPLPWRGSCAWRSFRTGHKCPGITDPSTVDPQCPQVGPVQSLGYELIVHVDRVIDYRPLSTSSVDCLERHSFRWCLGHWDDWSRAPPHRAICDRLGPHKRDCSPSGGTEGEPSHRRDRAGEPHHQGPGPHGPRQQKCQWVPTRGSRGPTNQGATLLELIPS